MKPHRLIGIALGSCALWLLPARPARSDVYKWVDKQGTVHFSDRIEDLPEPYRSQAVKKELEKKERERQERERQQREGRQVAPPPNSGTPPPLTFPSEKLPPAPPPEQSAGSEGVAGSEQDPTSKPFWQNKLKAAKKQVADLETKCKALEEARDQHNQHAILFSTPGDRQGALDADANLKVCQKDLAAAQKYLNEDLPEEARKAGIPPGWLR